MGFQLSLSLDNNGSPTVIYKPVNGIPTLSLDNNGSPTVIYTETVTKHLYRMVFTQKDGLVWSYGV